MNSEVLTLAMTAIAVILALGAVIENLEASASVAGEWWIASGVFWIAALLADWRG